MTQSRAQAIQELSERLAIEVTKVIDKNLRSCLNCLNFKEATELCDFYKQRPPARIIAKGCENWLDEIPF